MGNMAYEAGSILEACRESGGPAGDSRRALLFERTHIATLGPAALREYLGIPVAQELGTLLVSDKIASPTEAACLLCGLASYIVHHCFNYANDRKIMGKPLVEYQMTLAKLADLATLEAVLCQRHNAVISGAFDPENISEISGVFLRITAVSMEMLAGSGFVDESPMHDMAFLLNKALLEDIHVQHL
jgi:hypothetical protein